MHILIIDHDHHALQKACDFLRDKGYKCSGQTSPVAAVFAFAFDGEPFDAVITRHEMIGMNGMDILRVLTSIDQNIPVIMHTEEVTQGLSWEFTERGGFSLIKEDEFTEQILPALGLAETGLHSTASEELLLAVAGS